MIFYLPPLFLKNKIKQKKESGWNGWWYICFFLKICWGRKRSVILILSSYLVMIFAGFWKALCIWEFGIDKIVLCVRNGSSCIHMYTTPFLFRIDLLVYTCALLQFLGNSLPFFIFCGWKKQEKKNPLLMMEREMFTQIFAPWLFLKIVPAACVTDPPHFAWGNVGDDQKRKLPTTLFVVPLICFCAYLKHQSF